MKATPLAVGLLVVTISAATWWACGEDEPVDPDACTEEDKTEEGGPLCCVGGCGQSTQNPSPRVCKKGKYRCEKGVPLKACATQNNACEALQACGTTVGIGKDEKDPAADLCCKGGCSGTEAKHRVCGPQGTHYACPGGYVAVSECPDFENACGGVISSYRKNGNKLP